MIESDKSDQATAATGLPRTDSFTSASVEIAIAAEEAAEAARSKCAKTLA